MDALVHGEPLIEGHGISLKFGNRTILDHVDIDVMPGEIVTLIGPNGAGKSSLVRVLLGLEKPTAGRIARKRDLRIGYVPQRFPLTPNVPLDVKRLLALTLRPAPADIDAALAETGIAHLKDAGVASLSGGELQRALLARALLRKPELLVLDEPVQAVDFIGETRLYELISEIRRTHGCGILMVSHDLHMVMAESDRVICLNGHVCCEGGPETVRHDPEFVKLFGAQAARVIAAYSHHHDHDHESHDHSHDHDHKHHDHKH
ncbi:ATP-binding cassette domain-containing protein [Taklimakanibacter lacteus]|uniref:ATP-binding cassette domain-containing protein n=1 Tax=Taklimakanibacter lacteus TaxID=2268456 RepID=UPI000E65F6E7